MFLKICLFVFSTFIYATSSRFVPAPYPVPTCSSCSLLSTFATLVELAESDGCSSLPPCTKSCGCSTSCGCKSKPQFVDVILPPVAAELPCGLGYFPSAVPLAASAYGCLSPCDTCVPVTSPCSCTALATPLCAELRAFAKPIIL